MPSSCTQSEIIHGDDVTYQNETYKTVVICGQTWMARNLNYAVSGSKCGNSISNSLSDANTASCDTYGRLYNWALAMNLPSSCNTTSTNNSSCAVTAKHQGICPSGWHIPSLTEWNALVKIVNPNCAVKTNDDYTCVGGAGKLKATSGWNNGNGSNDYGFSALPGGVATSTSGNFIQSGGVGYWWSASEIVATAAFLINMNATDNITNNMSQKSNVLISVRCVKD